MTATRHPKVFYPLFIGAFPVISFYAANRDLSRPSDLWRPLAVTILSSALLWAIAALAFRNVARGAAFATTLVIGTFYFASFDRRLHPILGLSTAGVWAVVTVGIAIWAGCRWRWHTLSNNFACALVLVASMTAWGTGRSQARMLHQNLLASTEQGVRSASNGPSPDIYYLIVDGYGRADQLKRVLHFVNSPFLQQLKTQGFYVADQAHSNYIQTELSVASSLNMGYVQSLLPNEGRESDDHSPLDTLVNQSLVAATLQSRGYDFEAVTTGFPSFTFQTSDRQWGKAPRFTLLEMVLMSRTPFSRWLNHLGSPTTERRDMLTSAFTALNQIASRPKTDPSEKPKLVIAHILAPHPPFVFRADGGAPPWRHGYDIWDGSDYLQNVGSPSEYAAGYAGQVSWLNQQLISTVETILAHTQGRAVIVIQGDHGSKLRTDMNSLDHTDVQESMSNLMVFHVPPAVKAKLYPTITPVNVFRVLYSNLFGDKLPLVPDRSWYSPYTRPYAFTEVTQTLMSGDQTVGLHVERRTSDHTSLR